MKTINLRTYIKGLYSRDGIRDFKAIGMTLITQEVEYKEKRREGRGGERKGGI